MTAAACLVLGTATVRFWMNAWKLSAIWRWRFTKLRTSSKSTSTGALAAANMRVIASVPGGVVRALGPSAAIASSPASCLARANPWGFLAIAGVPGVADEDADPRRGCLGDPRCSQKLGDPGKP